MTDQKLPVAEITERAPDEFRQLLNALHARFRTDDFATALELTRRIGDAAEEMNHHPDLDLRWGRLDVKLTSHDTGGITERDIILAQKISDFAAGLGARAEPSEIVLVELGLDTWDTDEVMPFWRAILGYASPKVTHELVDSSGRQPTLWFQATDDHDTPRQRFHLDIWVPIDQAEARIKAALDAGGELVDDSTAPRFWVLADPQGNRVCICTVQDRDL